jgi:hypothetical protein
MKQAQRVQGLGSFSSSSRLRFPFLDVCFSAPKGRQATTLSPGGRVNRKALAAVAHVPVTLIFFRFLFLSFF